MKLAIVLSLALAAMTGCAIRYTESQIARSHGFTEQERRPEIEKRTDERCYSHDKYPHATAFCYLLGDTWDNYTVRP